MKMPFTITWEKITPEIAREYLTHNVKNRRLRKTTVAAYARDMRLGEWLCNHQGIAFDSDGNLIDGQHRLAAIVASGVAIEALVARGVPSTIEGKRATTMDTVDRGAARSVADMLQLSHGCPDAASVTAVCALLGMFSTGDSARIQKMTTPQALAVMDIWRPHIAAAVQNRSTKLGLRSAMVMAAIAFARAVEPAVVDKFYDQLVSGEGLFKATPLFTLRNHLLDSTGGRTRNERIQAMKVILTAIARHMKKEKMERIAVDPAAVEKFTSPQAEAMARCCEIFPRDCEGSLEEAGTLATSATLAGGAVSSATWKPTALAEDLLRGKAMSERIGKKVGGGAFICPLTGRAKKLRARNSAG